MALLLVQVRPHRREPIGPFVERVRSLPASRAVFHLKGPGDHLVHVAVSDPGELQRLVLDEWTWCREVAGVETRPIFREGDRGAAAAPGVSRLTIFGDDADPSRIRRCPHVRHHHQ